MMPFALAATLLLSAAPERAPKRPDSMITPAAEAGIERGLAWLASRQQEDGSFGTGPMRGNPAVCGLAGLALIAAGNAPARGPYGGNVSRCVEYLLKQSQPGGFIVAPGQPTHGPMYGHGFATLFLAECHGMAPQDALRDRLAAAVNIIVSSQNEQGGWRYYPEKRDADVSVTVCQVMALRAAHNAGVHVPKETVDRAIAYLKKAQNPDGGFLYMIEMGGESAFPRSAAAVVAFFSAGIYEGPVVSKGLEYLVTAADDQRAAFYDAYYEYAQYYAALAMWQAGDEYWKNWYP
ncbi:MAG: prenyltransferase/squalene oxidase repeat-containing protein, partial [Planctomycetota bacterium]